MAGDPLQENRCVASPTSLLPYLPALPPAVCSSGALRLPVFLHHCNGFAWMFWLHVCTCFRGEGVGVRWKRISDNGKAEAGARTALVPVRYVSLQGQGAGKSPVTQTEAGSPIGLLCASGHPRPFLLTALGKHAVLCVLFKMVSIAVQYSTYILWAFHSSHKVRS